MIEMNRLRRFYEKMPYGRQSNRIAFVTSITALPDAVADAEWTEDPNFNATAAVLADPDLKTIFKTALEKGCAVVAERAVERTK